MKHFIVHIYRLGKSGATGSKSFRFVARTGVRALIAVVAALGVVFCLSGTALAGDGPTGFYYGADSNGPSGVGSGYPYTESGTGGIYGGYVGEIGTWTNWQGCTSGRALSATDANEAIADMPWPGYGSGYQIPGVSFYWFAAGPGADPNYNRVNPSTTEAYDWGEAQAERAASQYPGNDDGITIPTGEYWPYMFMDIEGNNGWNSEINCNGTVIGTTPIPDTVERATFNGFYDWILANSPFEPGVYSAPGEWCPAFGSCPDYGYPNGDGAIPGVYEWTYEDSTNSDTPDPVGFCQSGNCAEWFGENESSRNTGWQWDQNSGDWNQWDVNNFYKRS
jgi:hypothetical protein